MTSRTALLRGATALAAATALATVVGCAGGGDGAASAPPAREAQVAPPVVNQEGVLSVCTALGLGAIPLFYFDEQQEPSGVEVEMAQDIAARLGLEYRAVSTAFPSLIPSLDAGQCDLVMGSLFITDERSAVVDFVPYLNSGSALIVTEDGAGEIEEYGDQLCGHRVGVVAGSSASVAVKELAAECDGSGDPLVLTEVDSAASGRQMLLNAQLDTMAGSSADMAYMVSESDGKLQLAGEPFESFEVGAAVKKGNTELQNAVQDAFDQMVADGRYDEILSSVGLESISYFD